MQMCAKMRLMKGSNRISLEKNTANLMISDFETERAIGQFFKYSQLKPCNLISALLYDFSYFSILSNHLIDHIRP